MDDRLTSRVMQNADFVKLVRTRSAFGWTLTVLMLLIYYGFIFIVAFVPAEMAIPVSGHITLGFPLGLFVIIAAVVLTGVYVWRANGEFDRLTRKIVAEAGR